MSIVSVVSSRCTALERLPGMVGRGCTGTVYVRTVDFNRHQWPRPRVSRLSIAPTSCLGHIKYFSVSDLPNKALTLPHGLVGPFGGS